ncbi:hypothetical protein [Desertibacillus haloalkaliphilus]|uniref:hypothetical protein n=1 Tax=Desertibacillus haloalkaliphilus TaxID=1328930 RepID=UPI001C265541|nr:hypothetical protein [Desertibacillus haloalkaliphilus]MBU8908525.1 hypothetical protein [Desertibacillus haloalkaliphilus]
MDPQNITMRQLISATAMLSNKSEKEILDMKVSDFMKMMNLARRKQNIKRVK